MSPIEVFTAQASQKEGKIISNVLIGW